MDGYTRTSRGKSCVTWWRGRRYAMLTVLHVRTHAKGSHARKRPHRIQATFTTKPTRPHGRLQPYLPLKKGSTEARTCPRCWSLNSSLSRSPPVVTVLIMVHEVYSRFCGAVVLVYPISYWWFVFVFLYSISIIALQVLGFVLYLFCCQHSGENWHLCYLSIVRVTCWYLGIIRWVDVLHIKWSETIWNQFGFSSTCGFLLRASMVQLIVCKES